MPTEPSVFRKESELAAQGALHAEIERMRVDLSNVRIQRQVIRSGLQIARAELKADIATCVHR